MTIDNRVFWYAARGSGIVSWALLTASVAWGLALSSQVFKGKGRPAWLNDMHAHLSALAAVFTGVHIAGMVADDYVHFGWAEILVPFTSSWHPLAVAAGVVAMWLLVAVEATSLAKRHLPKRLWRRVHLLSFPLFLLATGHGIAAGTDAAGAAAITVAAGACALVSGATAARVTNRRLNDLERQASARDRGRGPDAAAQRSMPRSDAARDTPTPDAAAASMAAMADGVSRSSSSAWRTSSSAPSPSPAPRQASIREDAVWSRPSDQSHSLR
jgi:DMSO/TMAO reductase YedYZ heme-binding membrane subunit